MKTSFYTKSSPVTRQLRPKLDIPKQTLSIQKLTFSSNKEGKTFVTIYPSQVYITSKDLIEMIEEKKESIPVKNNNCILRDDILYAIHNFASDENTTTPENHISDLTNTAQTTEPKRPTNAFILYRTALRKKIKALFPSFSNSDISKFTGAMWKAADKEVKEKYIKQAMECRALHKQMYPNFEYNIKKETSDQAASVSQKQDLSGDRWDNYFDQCLQNATMEFFNENHSVGDLKNDQGSSNWIDNVNPNVISVNSNNLLFEGYQESNEWKEVCNIVSQFFPEDSDQNTLMDDKLWASLGGMDLIIDKGYELPSYIEDNENSH
ncbi:hypothetical protein INT47_001946 [Mucor saturninus]|uniref:HMG box domain-containing protein n=1 Tax=Mucor saturninus TaxID=64648 RepID=A0A8H7VAX7_9FUNG|nr:hypothetical protein INT47_001946 [Mucor saturninus]